MLRIDQITEALINNSVCVKHGNTTQTGFWVDGTHILTCAHGLPNVLIDDNVKIHQLEFYFDAKVIFIDMYHDILLLLVNGNESGLVIDLDSDLQLGDCLNSWGFTDRCPGGESLSLKFEGWGRPPQLLKLSQGLVEPGMSGSPLLSSRTGKIVGMLKSTRDRAHPTGGRAVPSETILNLIEPHLPEKQNSGDGALVHDHEIPLICGIFEAAYGDAKTLSQIQLTEFTKIAEDWGDGRSAIDSILKSTDYDSRRREAITRWHKKNPLCLNFVVDDTGHSTFRIGATCVLPLRSDTYLKYLSGQITEFDITDDGIIGEKEGGKSRWLCFQSFGLSERLNRQKMILLRKAMHKHVLTLSDFEPSDVDRDLTNCRIMAEIGTSAGFHEAKHFGMSFVQQSKELRPMFELHYNNLFGNEGGAADK